MSRLPSETGKVSGRLGWAPPFVWAAASRWEGSNAGSVVPVVHDANFSWWPDAKVFTCALLHDSRFHFLSIEQVLLYSMNSLCSDIGQLEFGEEFSSDEENSSRLEFRIKFWSKGFVSKGNLEKNFWFQEWQVNNCHFLFQYYETAQDRCMSTLKAKNIWFCHVSSGKSLYFSHSFLMVVRRQDHIFNQA